MRHFLLKYLVFMLVTLYFSLLIFIILLLESATYLKAVAPGRCKASRVAVSSARFLTCGRQ